MKAYKLIAASLSSLLVPALASAQPEPADTSGFDRAIAPADHAFEVGVAAGYAQGGGKLGGNLGSLEDVAGAGGRVELDLGYRVSPELSLGVYGTFSTSQTGSLVASNTDVLGASAGIQAAWHFRPDHAVDPWVSLGTGWNGLWLNQPSSQGVKNTSLQGFELARLQVGADYRVSQDVAIAPVVGASLSLFVSEDSPMTTDYTEIKDKQVNLTGFAGLAGRFDLGGR